MTPEELATRRPPVRIRQPRYDEVRKIANEEQRSVTQMVDLLLARAIAAWRGKGK